MKKAIIIAAAAIVAVAVALTVYFVWFKKPSVRIDNTASQQNGVEQFESVSNEESTNKAGSLVGVWVGSTDGDFYYSFNSDKTGSYTMGQEVKTFKYKDNGDTVIITFDGNSKEHEYKYTVENNVLTIENDYGIMEKYNWK